MREGTPVRFVLNRLIRSLRRHSSPQFPLYFSFFGGGDLEFFLRQKRGKVKFLKARRGDTNFFRRH